MGAHVDIAAASGHYSATYFVNRGTYKTLLAKTVSPENKCSKV